MKFYYLATVLVSAVATSALGSLASFDFVARTYHAAGYVNSPGEGTPDLIGYGLGALEQVAYDADEQILYGVSEQGYVTIIDFSDPATAAQTPFAVAFEDTLTDVEVCGGYLFVAHKDDPNPGKVSIYQTAKRDDSVSPSREQMGSIVPPVLVTTVEVGIGPDMILPNADCTIVGVANEGEGNYDGGFLVDPEGSVSLVKAPFDDPTVVMVPLTNLGTDEDLIMKEVHMPLPLNALEYWDENSDNANDINFAAARASYTPAANLEPEYLAWSKDGSTLFVNLQENNALVTVDVASGTATGIHSYGLKAWEEIGIDVVEDDGCESFPNVEGLYTVRSPDSIYSAEVDGETYIFIANEGDDKEYGDYEERVKAKDVFTGTTLGLIGATAELEVFDPSDIASGSSKYFNADCDEANAATPFCSGSMRLTVGSSMVDYSDPAAPNIQRLVGLGGRGFSIYKVESDGLSLVWDSADELEKEGCAAFPWAHNSIQDEEFAPINGVLYNLTEPGDDLRGAIEENNNPEEDGCEDGGDGNPGTCPLSETVDERSLKDGIAPEAIVVASACGSRFVVAVGEKNSIGFLYNIDDVTNPELVKVFHLTPASENLNAGLAYADRTLGEVDPESIIFLNEDESPTGKAAVVFAGSWSGTLSYWEFSCDGDEPVTSASAGSSIVGFILLTFGAIATMF